MKLALIVPGGFDGGDREETIPALVDLAEALAARHEVHVFSTEGESPTPRHYELRGVPVHQLPARAPRSPRARALAGARAFLEWGRLALNLHRELARAERADGGTGGRGSRFDVLHAFWASEAGFLASLLGRERRTPVALSIGGGEAVWLPDIGYGGAGGVRGRARVTVAVRGAAVVTVGSAFARDALTPIVGAAAAARTRVVPLGIACAPLTAAPDRPAGPPWRLLHVASINRVKDQPTLLRALALAAGRLPAGAISLDVVGADTLAGATQAQAAALGVSGLVRFHGFLPPRRLPPLYRAAHLHVMSSRYESQGVAVLEAAAAGLPTVGTAVGILPTMAALSPPAARAVAPRDPEALAAAITQLLSDTNARTAMGAEARRFAEAHDAVATARAFEELHVAVAAGRHIS